MYQSQIIYSHACAVDFGNNLNVPLTIAGKCQKIVSSRFKRVIWPSDVVGTKFLWRDFPAPIVISLSPVPYLSPLER